MLLLGDRWSWSCWRGKQVHQQACKTQIPPYGLSRRFRLQYRLPHCNLYIGASVRFGDLAANSPRVSTFFVPGDLDLWPPKWKKTCPDNRPTHMQNFMPLPFSAAEKYVTIQTKKNKTKWRTSGSAGLQDASPTIRPWSLPPPPVPNALWPSCVILNRAIDRRDDHL